MTDIRFYHLQKATLDQTLPQLVGKAYAQGRRIMIKFPDKQSLNFMDKHLWTFQEESFLPHGSEKDGQAESQPIWLTLTDENPNDADVLILTHGATSDEIGNFALVCECLNGRDDEAIAAGRERWSQYKEAGHTLTYWQQSDQGRWEQKA